MSKSQTDTYHLLGNLLRFHARSRDTGGGYCLIEALTAPGAGAPPNRHANDDEAFYVLEGSFEFTIGDQTVEANSGSFVSIPNGAVHAFRNIGPKPGRLLIINTPGRAHDAFFSEAGEPMPRGHARDTTAGGRSRYLASARDWPPQRRGVLALSGHPRLIGSEAVDG